MKLNDMEKYSIQHRPQEKEYIVDYWTKRAERFTALRQDELHSEKYALWREQLASQLPAAPCSILDIGCGAGFFSIIMARLGYEVTGIDLTAEMITQAQKLAREEQVSCSFMVMDAEKLQFAEASFDVVISRNVTWNLPHPAKGYEEWLRVLKPGGLLINYDAEYAKYYNVDKAKKLEVHAGIAKALMEQCDNIYHMLDISLYERPQWDQEVLKALGQSHISVELDALRRIYPSADKFYVPEPVFCLRVVKE